LQALAILFGALFTVAVATALGASLLRDSCEDLALRFVTGAAALSVAVFCLCAAQLAYPLVFAILGIAALYPSRDRKGAIVFDFHNRLLLLAFLLYFILYFFNSMAPEASFDGSRYHLALAARYLRDHGFHRIANNMYASLSQGVEMLYLWAFAFGQHSAAAMVHFAFLLALVWQMFAYGRRVGLPLAGACGALLVFASPVVGVDGTSAYNDVAVAAIAFTLFHLLQIWDDVRAPRLLVAIGLVAGFGYAAKYTACLGVLYALGFVAWKSRRRIRETALATICAAVPMAPWMVKNWMWVGNPFAPFLNGLFPNPYFTVAFEQEYRHHMAMYELATRWQIPMQVTTYGSLAGLLGPVFLLAPIALLALRRREGRQLLLAALVFGATYFSNISTRFLIPPLPFVALAMALVLSRVPRVLVAVALVHALISWPSVVARYCHYDAWHLAKVPWREALRIKPEDAYLESNLPLYGAARLVEQTTAPGANVFALTPIPDAYTSRKVLVAQQSSVNVTIREILWTAFTPDYQPTWRLRFSFPPQPLRAVRVVQTNTAADLWSINELRVGQALPPANRVGQADPEGAPPANPRWRFNAQPYPWTIANAFDGNPITFWKCGEPLRPGQFVEVDFNAVEPAGSVEIETAPNQWGIRLKLEGQNASGQWKLLAAQPQASDGPVPPDLRRAAAEELKRRGIDYLLVFDGEFGADDLQRNAGLWGIRQVGEYKGARLYRLP
jgi:Dolichyl-phosphate-mannose-protein mannosyltransferase